MGQLVNRSTEFSRKLIVVVIGQPVDVSVYFVAAFPEL